MNGDRLIPCARPNGIPWHTAPKDAETPSATGTCGHTVWQYQRLAIGGHCITKTVGPEFGPVAAFFGWTPKKCALCTMEKVLATAACCPMCGVPILISSPVIVKDHPEPTTDIFPFLAYATRATVGPRNSFVFCMGCSPGPVCMTGYWTGNGVQRPDVSPMEMILSGQAGMIVMTSDGHIIIVSS